MILPPAKFFTQPPQQAGLDFDNPILKNIEHVISGNNAFLAQGKYNSFTRTGTIPPALIRRPSGLSYALGTGAAGVNWVATDAGAWVNAQTEWTCFTLSFWRGSSFNRAISTIAESPGSTTRDRSLVASASAGGFFQVSIRDGATDVFLSSTTTLTSIGANPFTLAGRATTSELSIFVNGVKENSTAITSTGRTYTSPELVLGQGGLGSGIANAQQGNSDPSILLFWSRALSDEELASLHRNPWQVFKSPKRIFVPEVVSGTTNDLLADNLQSTSSVSTPTLGQTHVLLANDLQSTSSLSTPTVGQVHVLLADNLQSASSLSTPSVSQTNALLADNLQSLSTVSTPTIVSLGTSALLANDLQSVSVISTPSLLQRKPINYAASASITSLSAITFYQNNNKWYGY